MNGASNGEHPCKPDSVWDQLNWRFLLVATGGAALVVSTTDLSPYPYLVSAHRHLPWTYLFNSGNLVADIAAYWFFFLGVISCILLFFVDAPYGCTYNPKWGLAMPAKWGWVLMEAPAALSMFYMYFNNQSDEPTTMSVWLLHLAYLATWELHYVYRAFIYPFNQSGGDKPMGVAVVGSAVMWTSVNGILNGYHLFWLQHHPSMNWWWEIARTATGFVFFFVGMRINRQSDEILKNLRKPGESGYKIPRGGMFDYVTKANYYGEIIEWAGWGLATWNVAGGLFFFNTMCNLVPRALREHRRCQQRFKDYPLERKAVFPFLL